MTQQPSSSVLDSSASEFVGRALGVSRVDVIERIQSLWGGQGQILRLRTGSSLHPTCVLKHISLNSKAQHPRGWNTSASYQRKATSYDVERCWYEQYAHYASARCKVPLLLGTHTDGGSSFILLEDLSTAYPRRCEKLQVSEVSVCLNWLANFHAQYLFNEGEGLWPEGCYWHLNTRLDEYAAMPEGPVKLAARTLNTRLADARYQTLVHGDAKVANFCFSPSLDAVAGVDFQYVGRGCGMKDVVYLLGSCLTGSECAQNEAALLDVYFNTLRRALSERLANDEIQELEMEWRSLYGVAWTDFYRFLLGWMPTHSKINAYTALLCDRTLSSL